MRLLTFSVIALLLTGVATANGGHGDLDVGPGTVAPDSSMYGIELAMDNAALWMGFAKPGKIAQERAAEASEMAEKGNYQAAQKAIDNMNKVAKRATTTDTEGLHKAQEVLEAVMQNAPEEAHDGLRTAIDNLHERQDSITGAHEDGNASEEHAEGPDEHGEDGEQTENQSERASGNAPETPAP